MLVQTPPATTRQRRLVQPRRPVLPLEFLAYGDLLSSPRAGGFDHYGVYLLDRRVLHFSGDARKDVKTATVRISRIEDFADGFAVQFKERSASTYDEIVERATMMLDGRGYHLLWRNCEHLARFVTTGQWTSTQVNTAALIITGIGIAKILSSSGKK